MRVRLVLCVIGLVLVWSALPEGPHRLQAQAPTGADDIVARVQQAFYSPGRDMKARVTFFGQFEQNSGVFLVARYEF
jgi:hypothetical protein